MPQIYGIEHILYLLVNVFLFVALLYYVNHHIKTPRQLDRFVRIFGVILLIAISWNRYSVASLRSGFGALLPGTFCGASSLALALSSIFLKRNHPVFHSVAYTALLGGLLTIFYPDFIGQSDSIFYPMTISGLIHHSLSVILVVIMLLKGYLLPELKKWYYLPLGLTVYMCYGLFLITMLGYGDAMYIHEPILEGTPLNWFVLGMIFLPVHALFLWGWRAIDQVVKSRWAIPVLNQHE